MPYVDRRSRSTTAASQRPLSRASTTSIHTAPLLPVGSQMPQYSQDSYTSQHVRNQHQILDQYNEADIISLQNVANPYEQQLHSMPLEADLQAHIQHHGQNGYYQDHQQHYSAQQGIDYGHMHALPPRPMSASGTSNGKGKRKGGSAANAANEKHEQELHEMLARNQSRTLSDVGSEVLKNERTPKCEKSKQLFAMLWLNEACIPAKTSVPRGRVYGTYADRCGDERVQPLNPASFGKLVRVIFPGITTRRLGVRGESKYHYVDLALKNDPEEEKLRRSMDGVDEAPVRTFIKPAPVDVGVISRLDPESAKPFTADEVSHHTVPTPAPAPASAPLPQQGDGGVFADTTNPGFLPRGLYTANSYRQQLSFQPPEPAPDSIMLPDIGRYLPKQHDGDTANSLTALYRSHCTSLVDCIRFAKEKQFFRLFTSFSGTLTVPVQKLFVDPALAPWIKECDWLMYQNMVQCVSHLTLHVLPMKVTRLLDTIAKSLRVHITKTFQGHPSHVLEAKLEPATLFCELVARLLKVNSTAHAAAVVLQDPENRTGMWRCWVETINPKKLIESELPWCGHEETYQILTQELLPLLEPVCFVEVSTAGTHYANKTSQNTDNLPESYIDRIGTFVQSIPSRFPNASPRTIVDAVKNIGTAAMRDLTINQASGFHAWWMVKIFVDEMVQWLATSGGFLAHRPVPREQPVFDHSGLGCTNGSRHGAQGQQPSRSYGAATEFLPNVYASTYQAHQSQNHNIIQNLTQNQPASGTFKAPIRPLLDRKRSAADDDVEHELQNPGKRTRIDPTSHPQFQHNNSFGSSFGSTTIPMRPETVQDAHDLHDDSGIGLELFDPPFFPSKAETKRDHGHLDQSGHETLAAALAG